MSKTVKQHIRTHERNALGRASLLIIFLGLPLLLWTLKVANKKAAAEVVEPQKSYLSYLLLTNNLVEIQRSINSMSFSETIQQSTLKDPHGKVIAVSVPKTSKAISIGRDTTLLDAGNGQIFTLEWAYQISWFQILMVSGSIVFVVLCIAVFVRRELNQIIITLGQPIALITQVAHDIRSPLSSLNILANDALLAPDKKEIFQNAIARINDIANELLVTGKNFNSEAAVHLKPVNITKIVDEIIHEKKIQFQKNKNLEFEIDSSLSEAAWARVNATDFARIVSNIVNNAIESLNNDSGKISVGVRVYSENISIFIQDNGRGMSPDTMNKLGKEEFTTGSGSGLGTFHAFNKVRQWGGQIEVSSKIGEGTVFNIQLLKDKSCV